MRSALLWDVTKRVGPMGYPETSVMNSHHALRNIPEERMSRLHNFSAFSFQSVPLVLTPTFCWH